MSEEETQPGAARRSLGAAQRFRAWLVTGSLGRGLAFAIDFALAVRKGLLRRPRR